MIYCSPTAEIQQQTGCFVTYFNDKPRNFKLSRTEKDVNIWCRLLLLINLNSSNSITVHVHVISVTKCSSYELAFLNQISEFPTKPQIFTPLSKTCFRERCGNLCHGKFAKKKMNFWQYPC